MKWRVVRPGKDDDVVEAESAYVNQVGTLLFLRKAAAPIVPDAPVKKKPGWPKKAATVTVRGFNATKWDEFVLVEE